jgi:hypothetical protein
MEPGLATVEKCGRPAAARWPAPPPGPRLEPLDPAELHAEVRAGEVAADLYEALLAQVARAHGALDLAIGEGLAAMCLGDRLIRLGFSCLGDYARELLDIRERTAEAMAHLARALRERPLLRAAVRSGEVRIRSATAVLPVARGEAEAGWVERARHETVRSLEKAVRAARRPAGDEDEWTRVRVGLSPEDRAVVDEALALAGKVLGGGATRAERLEALAQEYLGEHPTEAGDDGGGPAGSAFRPVHGVREWLEARLEVETERWAVLREVCDVPEPELGLDAAATAGQLDARLHELAAMRASWGDLLGHCACVLRRSGVWRLLGFASFRHYCRERLGLSGRMVEERAAVEERLWRSPALRAARDAGLSHEKVRLLSRLPADEVVPWFPRARSATCVALRRALEEAEDRQMRAARVLTARVPERTARLLAAAFRAVRAAEERFLGDGACLVIVARHFLETWRRLVPGSRSRSQKVRERDLGWCQVPGCSRRATHAHHITPRSHGGGHEPANLVAVCGCHHLRGLHGGYLRVRGRAPEALSWRLGGCVPLVFPAPP